MSLIKGLAESRARVIGLVAAVLLATIAIQLLGVLLLNDGLLVYTLDDPYIHLALAENIARGHYGINPGESSAPSSSVVWPFLLAPLASFPLGSYVPFVLNLVVATATLLLYAVVLEQSAILSEGWEQNLFLGLALLLLIWFTNLACLVFTGMEHSLQLFLACLLVVGLIREAKTKHAPWWLLAAIVLGPLVRYENLALSLPLLLYLFCRDHRRSAIIAGAVLMVALAGFSLFLMGMGLGPLPSSVVAKSPMLYYGPNLGAVIRHLYLKLREPRAVMLMIMLVTFSFVALSPARDRGERLLAGAFGLGISLHLLAGDFGQCARYVAYISAASILALVYLARKTIAAVLESQGYLRVSLVLALSVALLCVDNLFWSAATPLASNNIYEQQHQMHRFVTEYYQAPVAANDIGWVSYRNEEYVLDLVGLSSVEALEARRRGSYPEAMDELANAHNVQLAMVYDRWFPEVPDNWRAVAKLYLGKFKLTPASHVVTFYVTDPAAEAHTIDLLRDFRETLPDGVELELLPDESSEGVDPAAVFLAPVARC